MSLVRHKTNRACWTVLGVVSLMTIFASASSYAAPQSGKQGKTPQAQCGCATSQGTSAPCVVADKVVANPDVNPPMTAAQGEAIVRELQAIRVLLREDSGPGRRAGSPVTPWPAKIKINSGWHELGSSEAPVTLIEFTDLQCPFCRQFQTNVFAEIKRNYIDTGKVRFIALDLPLPMHPLAPQAAEAEHCAAAQGKFWEFREAVLDDKLPPTTDVLMRHAEELGLDSHKFQTCLNNDQYQKQIEVDQRDAGALGIHGTPAFVIGRVKEEWLDGLAVTGARPFAFFQQWIEQALTEASSEPPTTPSIQGQSLVSGSASVGGN